MKTRIYVPSPDLRPFVRQYWICEVEPSDLPFRQWIFPYGAFELILNLDTPPTSCMIRSSESFIQPVCYYAGQLTQPVVVQSDNPCSCLGVTFHPWVGDLLLRTSASEFTDKFVDITLAGIRCEEVETMLESGCRSRLIGSVENFLRRRLFERRHDALAAALSLRILVNQSSERLNVLLKDLGVSRRTAQLRFVRSTGLTMSSFRRKVRFQRAVRLLKERPRARCSEISHEANYFDQPHFIREFRSFSGTTPLEFAERSSKFAEFFTSLLPSSNPVVEVPVH